MTQSPRIQQHAQLIREMSRDSNKTRRSTSSKGSHDDAGFTTSDFDPENDALMSTRQLDNFSQRLPELRASAQKYSRYSRPEPDYAINTSAIARAFPDFSQGPSSLQDDSISIEIGRGLKDGEKEEHGRSSVAGHDMDFSLAMSSNYQPKDQSPKQPLRTATKSGETNRNSVRHNTHARHSSGLRKEVLPSSPPAAKTTDYGSGGSRHGSAETRQTLAAVHARITDDDNDSVLSEERPPTLNLTSRGTRFASGRRAKAPEVSALPSKFTSTQGFMKAASRGFTDKAHQSKAQEQNGTVSSGNPTLQQSTLLPDLPNLSELVSGVFEDGTPVFSRTSKPRASRFASGSRRAQVSSLETKFAKVSGIPVPDDEQAIFLSLKLLQDKVADLERSRAEAESTIQELHEKNQSLEREKAETKRFRRSDSALGTTDGSDAGDEVARGPRKWTIEKTRLEASVRALQEQMNSASRKASVSQITIKNLTQERESAVAQLGVAYFTTEQLKSENEQLKEENMRLQAEISQLKAKSEDRTQKMTQIEENLRKKIQRRDETVQSLRELTRNMSTVQRSGAPADPRKTSSRSKNRIKPDHTAQDSEVVAQDAETGRTGAVLATNTSPRKDQPRPVDKEQNRLRRKKTRLVVEEYSESEASEASLNELDTGITGTATQTKPMTTRFEQNPDGDAADLTFLSLVDSREIANLRKTLEQERLARKQRGGLPQGLNSVPDATKTIDMAAQKPPIVPRKSSMKDLTGRVSNAQDNTGHVQQDVDHTTHSKVSVLPSRRHSENSLLEQRNQRHGLGMEEMTSAFILPDITMRIPATQKVSPAGQDLFDLLPNHDGQNCTICKRTISPGNPHNHDELKEKITIPNPIPVSDRMPVKIPYEEEPTIRPSESPPLALAKVLKCLEDELTHLKLQQARQQALYNQHDPALSKRKRKSVLASIEKVMNAVDAKADQIYALYDVLEGQKREGRVMGEEEVEMTLQSIGVDLERLGLRGAEGVQVERKKVEVWEKESCEGGEGEGAWDGFGSTGGWTGRKSWGV